MTDLDSISPVDGRYNTHTDELRGIFSESGLIRARLMVEGEYLIALSELSGVGPREFTGDEKKTIRALYDISAEEIQIVKDIETKGFEDIKATNHDVKAVEYFIKYKLKTTTLKDSLEWIHFALTSEDTNNLAYGLMLSESLSEALIPKLDEIFEKLEQFARDYKDIAILSRTHGQPASPTTFGKEFKVFSARIRRQLEQLDNHKILVKLNGATGNYSAHMAAYPKIDWQGFSKRFVESLSQDRSVKLELNPVTTQIEPHDSFVEIFDNLRRINTILIGLDQDIWRYISDNWLIQRPIEGEIGSSTMPHKVNPIDFENSEGNLGLANALFTFFANKLPLSRLQRDLSDSTVQRNIGVAFAHSLVAYKYLLKGLSKISINESRVKDDLLKHPEILAEAIQTILRREGLDQPYEKLKSLTRGKEVTMGDIKDFIESLDVSDVVKKELLALTPENYTGLASKLTEI